MPGWIIAAALASIAVTGVLTFVLWRVNTPMLERNKKSDGGGEVGIAPQAGSSGSRHDRADDGDSGGGDGGGGDGGGD